MIRVRCPGQAPLLLPPCTLGEVQERIRQEWGIPVAHQRLVCNGQVLQDDVEIISAGAVIFVSRTATSKSPPPAPSPPAAAPAMGPGIPSGLLEALTGSPQILQAAFMQNPQIKRMAEQSPEFRAALNDPDTLAQMIKASVDPRAQAELQRGQDRMMSNLEMIPEGFQHLRRWHEQVDALTADHHNPVKPISPSSALADSAPDRQLNTEALPNPWGRKRPRLSALRDEDFLARLEQLMQSQEGPGNDNDDDVDAEQFDWEQMRRALQSPTLSLPPSPPTPLHLSPPILNPTDDAELKAKFETELALLQQMGFGDEEANLRALLMAGGNVNAAIELLLRTLNK